VRSLGRDAILSFSSLGFVDWRGGDLERRSSLVVLIGYCCSRNRSSEMDRRYLGDGLQGDFDVLAEW
jgi:hypothetical protein